MKYLHSKNMKYLLSNTTNILKKFLLKSQREFKEIYYESGINLSYYDYKKRIMIAASILYPCILVSTILIHKLLLNMPWFRVLPAALSISIALTVFVVLVLLYYPLYSSNQIRAKIENGLVYTLSYMTILSTGGISIEHIMERISEVEENSWIKKLVDKFILDVKIFGFEVSAALEDISKRSPSNVFKKLLSSIDNSVRTSGDLKSLLSFEVEGLLQVKRESLKKRLGTLTYLGEMYVSLIVVAPILFIVMITMLSVLGGGSFSNSAIPQLNLIVFLGIPILATGFILILEMIIGGEE